MRQSTSLESDGSLQEYLLGISVVRRIREMLRLIRFAAASTHILACTIASKENKVINELLESWEFIEE